MSRILLLLTVLILVLVFVLLNKFQFPSVIWFVGLGLIIGLYYGYFNNSVFHQSAKFNNEYEKVQALWIHIVCGQASALTCYLLYEKATTNLSSFGLTEFGLLLFTILGICGLLPRAFWFLANKGDFKI